ncbi:MAG TPA: tetratricopeptide repeat protein [Candidatus Dormibacteraeota bacterium]|jgi:tetratricopeptide (TPR) repeat protein|nr:tetratricopeptide repeat protein [Candidatus Dormibacteraeota bacterium]
MKVFRTDRHDWVRAALIAIALIYAVLAGLRLVSETDLGWQMATGRYIVQHHRIPSTALFTYTVPGANWVYPPLSGLIFYLFFSVGGFAALSYLSAVACAGTIVLMTWRGSTTTVALAIVAVPAIAFRTAPRADLFTTVLFAAVLVLLWRHHEGKLVRLWLLPVLMLVWVNLHLGFISGLALMGGYLLMEGCAALFADKREAALKRARQALPWIAASVAVTIANPWGIGIYRSLALQNAAAQPSVDFIGEWSGMHFNSLALRQFFSPRDPASADWWIFALGVLAILICLWKKRVGAAIVLSGAMYESVQHLRFQGIFTMLAVVIGGTVLPEVTEIFASPKKPFAAEQANVATTREKSAAIGICFAIAAAIFAGVRAYDLVSQKHYVEAGEITLFGAGESWWFPEKAMEFLEREKLPGNLFHSYNYGGYLNFRVGESYPVFADGRYIPFGREIFLQQRAMEAALPDSRLWEQSAAKWKINTIVFSLSRYAGLNSFPLAEFCRSTAWKPVYVDDVSIVFVRNLPENAQWLERFTINCYKAVLPEPAAARGDNWRAKAERFNFLMNSGSAYYILSRDAEAYAALQQAEALFPENESLHLTKAQLLQANNRMAEAEQEYLRAVNARPSDAAWFALATLYNSEKRYAEAERCVREAISLSLTQHERLRSLGLLDISMGRPKDALAEFDRADAKSPFRSDTTSEEGRSFNARLAAARAKALKTMNDLPGAIEQQERAAQLTPENPTAWDILADLADAKGDIALAHLARDRAVSVRATSQASLPH